MGELGEGRLIFGITVGILMGLFFALLYFGVTARRQLLDALVATGAGFLGLAYDAVINTLGVTPIVFVRGTMIAAAAFTLAVVVAIGVALSRGARLRKRESHE